MVITSGWKTGQWKVAIPRLKITVMLNKKTGSV